MGDIDLETIGTASSSSSKCGSGGVRGKRTHTGVSVHPATKLPDNWIPAVLALGLNSYADVGTCIHRRELGRKARSSVVWGRTNGIIIRQKEERRRLTAGCHSGSSSSSFACKITELSSLMN